MIRTLIMGLGTGTASGGEKLAQALTKSINNSRPDKIIYIATPQSRLTTLPHLPSTYTSEVIELQDADNLQRIFNQLIPIFKAARMEASELYVDYTSGTKTMTCALAMHSILYEADILSVVSGERRNGTVQSGTEMIQTLEPGFAVGEMKMQKAIVLFNENNFSAAAKILEEIQAATTETTLRGRVDSLYHASKAYYEWDRFEHVKAYDELKQAEDTRYNMNLGFLRAFISEKSFNQGTRNDKTPHHVADLLNNAKRRGDEARYDDAVARLYRVVELIAQYKLRSHGVDASRTLIEQVPEPLKSEWAIHVDKGVLRLSLQQDFALLKALGDLAGGIVDDSDLRGLLEARNNSILAHGISPVSEAAYSKLYVIVESNALRYVEGLKELVRKSVFLRYPVETTARSQ